MYRSFGLKKKAKTNKYTESCHQEGYQWGAHTEKEHMYCVRRNGREKERMMLQNMIYGIYMFGKNGDVIE